ncbi:hypothetical protein PDE01_18230 [Paracoccus denitrificans]|nr:hypothetical protein PDE01_18230 [Paracoccus denitrificans]
MPGWQGDRPGGAGTLEYLGNGEALKGNGQPCKAGRHPRGGADQKLRETDSLKFRPGAGPLSQVAGV